MKTNAKIAGACLLTTAALLAGINVTSVDAYAAESAPAIEQAAVEEAARIAAEQAAAEEAARIAAEQAAAEEAARIAAEQAAAEEAARIAAEQAAEQEAARIAAEQAAAEEAARIAAQQAAAMNLTVLAQIMMHEALYEGEAGMIAVGEVVMNRVMSPLFPNSIEEVVFQRGQFTSAHSISRFTPSEYEMALAAGVASGQLKVLNNAGILYFRNAVRCGAAATSNWGRHAFAGMIGRHSFYVQ